MTLWNALGTLGAGAVILAYAQLQLGRWRSEDLIYSTTNTLGASLILVPLAVEPNLPSIFIESFWLLISLLGVLRGRRDTPCGKQR